MNLRIYVICQTIGTLGTWGAVAAIAIFNPTNDVFWTLIAGVVVTAIIWRGEEIF